jgi:hypothetical protein
LYDLPNASIHAALIAKRTLRRLDQVGEKQNQPFHLSFNSCLKVDFQGFWAKKEIPVKVGLEGLFLRLRMLRTSGIPTHQKG